MLTYADTELPGLTRKRRGIVSRSWRALRRVILRWQTWETEHYLRDCYRDGLHDSLSLLDFRNQLAAMRLRLIDLED